MRDNSMERDHSVYWRWVKGNIKELDTELAGKAAYHFSGG